MRYYRTYSKMLHNKYQDKIEQPDLRHIETLHAILDTLDEQKAMMIDLIVADLIRCAYPPVHHPDAIPPEIIV